MGKPYGSAGMQLLFFLLKNEKASIKKPWLATFESARAFLGMDE